MPFEAPRPREAGPVIRRVDAELALKHPPHPILITETRLPSDLLQGFFRFLEGYARGIDPHGFDRLARSAAGCGRVIAHERPATHSCLGGQLFDPQVVGKVLPYPGMQGGEFAAIRELRREGHAELRLA